MLELKIMLELIKRPEPKFLAAKDAQISCVWDPKFQPFVKRKESVLISHGMWANSVRDDKYHQPTAKAAYPTL